MRVIASLIILASTCAAFSANKKAPPAESSSKNTLSRRDIFLGAGAATIAATFWDVEFLGVVKGKTQLPPINGIYSDPNHIKGYRVVRSVDKNNAVVTLQDEPNGPIITVDGKIKTPFGNTAEATISLDLSAKGGPSDLVATFSDLSGGQQIIFPDGNAWTKSAGVDGIYSDPNHPAGYRVVRVVKNKMYITLQDEPSGDIIEVVGTKSGNDFLIDFSSKGGPKDIAATVEEGKLVFPDGNAWVKV